MKFPISILWNETEDTSPSAGAAKQELVRRSGGVLTESDRKVSWLNLDSTKKNKLLDLYYNDDEKTEVTITELDNLVSK